MPQWNADKYSEFINERTQPAIDLANRISLDNPKKIIDIGCGPGNSTRVLANRFFGAHIVGADNSQDMIDKAKGQNPDLDFMIFDASGDFSKFGEYDIVFSNACIQWIPNHSSLIKNMMSVLKVGGVLAVQTPMNYNEPIHIIIKELAASEKWKNKIKNPRIFYNLTQNEYFDILSELASDFTMWETVYCHRMPSHSSIMEWYKGTGLRPYLQALSDTDAADFESDVYSEVVKAYPIQANGEIIFRFPRFFFTAIK
ncbi:MAG: methyltransferase domain-containing protein [Acutalibacteraceae bacterium]